MTKLPLQTLLLAALTCASAAAFAQAAPTASRGELLYITHCSECHTTQMYWRDDGCAQDWAGLKVQVRRWQDNNGLGWSESEIAEVARYLNDAIYRYPQTSDRLSLAR